MRLLGPSRRALTLAVSVAAAVLCAAAPAAADATVSPATATQGAGVNLTFTVRNDHPKAAITKVRLVMPPATPVAEVYALSVPDWAPKTTNRTLNPPLRSIHGGAPVTETTQDILWTAMGGRTIAPGASSDLMVAMGPMPSSEAMTFTLQPTYADGSTGPALSPVSIALTAPAPVVEDPTGGEDFSDVLADADAEADAGFRTNAGWIVAALVGVAAIVAVLQSRRARRPGQPAAERNDLDGADPDGSARGSGTDGTPGPDAVAAGAKTRVTAWSYRDGP